MFRSGENVYTSTKIDWTVQVGDPLKGLCVKVISFLPTIVEALGILVIGWALSWLVMKLIKKFLDAIHFDQIAEITGVSEVLNEEKIKESQASWVSKLFYWFGIFITCIIALDTLHLRIPSVMLDDMGFFVSMMLTGLVIFLLGLFLSMIASKFVESTARKLKAGNPTLQAAVIRWAIILMTFVVTMTRFGFPKDLIFIVMAAIGLTLCVTFTIAFGVGGISFTPKLLEKFLK